jgi:hypothetical protein
VGAQEWIGLIGAISAPLATVIGYFLTRHKVGKVEGLVNGQMERQLNRNDQLARTLTAADVEVPARPSEGGAGRHRKD